MQFKTVLKQGTEGIPELAVSLQQLSQLLQRELSNIQEDSYPEPHLKEDVHITGMLARLDVLQQVLELVPRPLAMQFSKESPVGGELVLVSANAHHMTEPFSGTHAVQSSLPEGQYQS